jgi:glycosyltransferase XagB
MNNVANSRPINRGVPVRALSLVRELSPSASRGQGRRRSAGAGAAPLPLEIGFLAAHGVRLDRLRYAAMVAILAGVSPGEAALALGLVPEETFYRALAAELGLPFVRHPRVSALARFPHSLTVGLAPAPGRGFVTAPPAREVGRLLAVRRRLGGPLAVTTPSGLRAAVFAAAGPRIADLAAHDLPRQRSALSYRDGTTPAQIALAAFASAGSSAGLVLAPGLVGGIAALGLGALFFGMVVLRFAALRIDAPISPPEKPPRLADHLLPVYTIVAPLRAERRVVAKLITALQALDYPAAKLDIMIVIEADDRETADAIEEVGLSPWMAVVTAPPGEPRTKPRALNVALPLARGVFTVVYDAEDEPEPDQLRLAVARFADEGPEVACLQARLAIDNTDDGWIPRLFTIEYAALFDVINPALAAFGLPIPLGGTSNHFRTSALRRVGGWDAWNVTEDADLGIRLARHAYRTVDLPSTTREEAPRSLGAGSARAG